jgi:hypothetical protein
MYHSQFGKWENIRFLGAKLFGSAALVIAALGLLFGGFKYAPFGRVIIDHTSFSADHLLLAFALLCGVLALLHYLADSGTQARSSTVLSVGHFLLWMFALIAFCFGEIALDQAVRTGHDPNQSSLAIGGSAAAVLAFFVGGLLFLINLGWVISRKFRTQSSD